MDKQRLEGFYSFSADADNNSAPLPEKQCVAVKLSVWAETDGGGTIADLDDETIYYGFAGNCVHPLKAGETTDYIFASNLKQIFVRCTNRKTGKTKVYFSCFREVE